MVNLARDLQSLAVRVWWDEWQVRAGDSLYGRIGDALEASDFVAVVLSPDSVSSPWCKDELQQALAREKRTMEPVVLPILCRSVLPPPFLEGRAYLDFRSSYWRPLGALAGRIHALDPQVIAENFERLQPCSLESLQHLLNLSGFREAHAIPAQAFQYLRSLIQRTGTQTSEERLSLMVPHPAGGDDVFVFVPSAILSSRATRSQPKQLSQGAALGDTDSNSHNGDRKRVDVRFRALKKIRILILTSSPCETTSSTMDEEVREIREALRRCPDVERFHATVAPVTRGQELIRSLLEIRPHIVHILGHVGHNRGMLFEGENDLARLVDADALGKVFRLCRETCCVVLNTSFSAQQLSKIRKHVDYVIGMRGSASEANAIAFTRVFYDAIAADQSIYTAFEWGRAALLMQGRELADLVELL